MGGRDRGSAGCGVGGGTRSGGAWLRLRHATSTRPSSPPSSYLVSRASSRHLTAATSLAATTPDPDPLLPSRSLLPFLPPSRSRGRTLLPLPPMSCLPLPDGRRPGLLTRSALSFSRTAKPLFIVVVIFFKNASDLRKNLDANLSLSPQSMCSDLATSHHRRRGAYV